MENPILAKRNILIANANAQFSKGEDIEVLEESQLDGQSVFEERAVNQLVSDLFKAESTGFFSGRRVTKNEIQKAKDKAAKLEKKVVKDKNGGTKTVYVNVVEQTKAHHKMSHEELMEHHSSEELHQIADNYKVNHDNIAQSVEKNGAADDPYKSQKAVNKRSDVASAEEAYMHIKQAAYKKEKLEGKAGQKATKDINKPYKPGEKTDDVKKSFQCDILEKGGSSPELTRKQIIDKNGHSKTVYVRNWDTEEHHFAVGHKVHFQHKDGKQGVGDITGMKYHAKYDKFGTATIRDAEGNEHSRSLKNVENHKDNDFKYDTSKEDKPEAKGDKVSMDDLKKHPNFHQNDYDHLSGKGYDNNEIKDIWDKDHKDGKGPVTVNTNKEREKIGEGSDHSNAKAAEITAKLAAEKKSPTVESAKTLFDKINDEASKTGESVVKYSDTEYYSQQIQNIYNLSSEKADELAKKLNETTATKSKLSGTEAINKKNKDLKAIEEQLKNHESGVKKLSDDELAALKTKKEVTAKTIKQLESKLNVEKALSFLMGDTETFEK